MSNDPKDYLDLFSSSIRILNADVDEDGDSVEADRFSHSTGHYTETVGHEYWASANIIARVLLRVDEDCIAEFGEHDDFDPESPSFPFEVAEELAISSTGEGDPDETLVDVLESEGYGDISFSNFTILKYRKLADNHYLIQFRVEAESGNGDKKAEWAQDDADEAEIAAYEDRMEMERDYYL